MNTDNLIGVAYLIATLLFIIGLKRFNSPATARSGNFLSSAGMFIAIIATLYDQQIINYQTIAIGIVIGSVIGALMSRTIRMTAMPQLVAIFNGLGGGASSIVAASEFTRLYTKSSIEPAVSFSIMFGTLIGLVTLSGSVVAFLKLQGILRGQPITFPLQKSVSTVLFIVILAAIVYLIQSSFMPLYLALVIACLLLGLLLVIPIGGADMPVVISLLNSYSGIAAAAAGFILGNVMLIVAGALVGAAGIILTQIMIKAMNRSLANVMFGAFGASDQSITADISSNSKPIRQTTAQDAAVMLAYARSAIFVPGYGLAVSQAQHQLKELGTLMDQRGVSVKYAIHPVAGRMSGHMNVLLAEAEVSYDKLFDLEQINDEFSNTDVVLVIGANDVVNPDARDNSTSPLYGMPILEVDLAQQVLVLKRSLNPGFAGIDNELFYKSNTSMLFGDAKASLGTLIEEIKQA